MRDSPLIYLTLCSMRNQLRVRLRRLRQPRYLIGTVLGLSYLYFFLLRPGGWAGRGQGFPGFAALAARGRVVVELGAAALAFVTVALAWIWPGSRRPALAFSRADVQFLFTAPISRRRLVRYRVLRSQLGALVGSAIMTLLFRPASVAEGWTFFLGLSLVMALLNLHLTGVSLSRATIGTPGPAGLARRWIPLAVVAAGVAVVGGTLASHWADLMATAARGGSVMAEIERLGTSGPAGVVLWPFRMIVRLPLAESAATFLAALPWTLAAIWLNYVWVLRTDVAFEEASAELSEKIAKLRKEGLSALQRPRSPASTPFTLSIEGPAETAILWKNLISMGRFLSWKLLARFVPLVIMLTVMVTLGGRRGDATNVLAFLCVFAGGFAVVLGPQMVRSDLRQDLASLAVLKTWPVRGAALVRGEVLAPAIVLTSVATLALVVGAVLLTDPSIPLPAADRWAWLVAALLVAPGVILAQLLVQNGLAVSFPSWVTIGTPQRGGVDVMGQRLLMTMVSMLALVLILLPAALVGGLAALAGYAIMGTIPVVVPGILAAGTLQVEAFLGTEMVGAILDRTDVSAIDAPDT